jgi:pteridine reductase
MNLNGKVALVTGSAHRVGRAIALGLARAGAQQVIHYGGSAVAAGQTRDEVAALGVEAITVPANLSDPAQIDELFDAIEEHFGRLDILVNSAATFVHEPFDAVTAETWDAVLAVNLRAPFLCSQRAAHLMLARRSGGVIVNIADVAGQVPWVRYPQHSVSKAGLLMLTQVMAKSLGPDIRVNAVVPGPVLKPEMTNLGVWEELGARLPLKRTGRPEHVAHAVLALVENDYITGAALAVDGGDTLMGTLDML